MEALVCSSHLKLPLIVNPTIADMREEAGYDPNFPPDLCIFPSRAGASGSGSLAADEAARYDDIDTLSGWIKQFGIAGRTWEAVYYLRDYLTPPSSTSAYSFDPPCPFFALQPSPKVILELGSGNGYLCTQHLPQYLNAHHDDRVVLTDLENVVPLMEQNAAQSKQRQMLAVEPLAWGNAGHIQKLLQKYRPTHILCSDLVYFPHLLAPLLRTLILLTDDFESGGKEIEVIIGYKVRSLTKEQAFWDSFGVYFELFPVIRRDRANEGEDAASPLHLPDEADETSTDDQGSDRIFIFLAQRKSGSSFKAKGAELPVEDDLLKGKDGQFEEFLMLDSMAGDL